MVTVLRSGQGHMSVGDSAEEFISIHALGRERLLVLSCGLPSHPLKLCVYARWETIESFVSVFYTPAAKCVFNRSLIGARHKSPAVERPLYTKGGSEPSTSWPRSEFTALSLISSNEVCGDHEITPRLSKICLRIFKGVGQDRREKSCFPGVLESFQK